MVRRGWLVLLCVVAIALAGSPCARATDQLPLPDVLSALGLTRKPADYVIVVDTSQSMRDEGRYDRVRSALREMMGSLDPTDHVSLITFDGSARVLYRGPRGTNPSGILSSLPPLPEGTNTDIGAGLSQGVAEFERTEAATAGVLVLVTDGKQDAATGSPYASANSPAWQNLRRRADAVAATHSIVASAIELGAATDAALLKQVFPTAGILPGNEIVRQLMALSDSLLKFQATERLRPDVAQQVTASWSPVNAQRIASGGPVDVTLTLTSPYATLPVEVTGLGLSTEGPGAVSATGLPPTVTLGPGERRELPVKLTLTGGSGATTHVQLGGAVTSPWHDVVVKDLALAFPDALSSQALNLAGPPGSGTAPAQPSAAAQVQLPGITRGQVLGLLALVAIAAVALVARMVWRAARPRLQGSLLVLRGGEPLREFLLEGRSVSLKRVVGTSVPGLSGVVTARRAPGNDPAITLAARYQGKGTSLVVKDGQSATIGDLTFSYTGQASRILSMINAPAQQGRAAVDGGAGGSAHQG